jgi:hypothetical protein
MIVDEYTFKPLLLHKESKKLLDGEGYDFVKERKSNYIICDDHIIVCLESYSAQKEEEKINKRKFTYFADKTITAPHSQDRDPQKQQQRHRNLEVSNSHKLKWFQKYHQAAHLRQE